MEEENSNNCHFQFGDRILDIKSEKMVKSDEPEKIKVTVFTSEGDYSNTTIQVFEITDTRIRMFIRGSVGKFFSLS